MALLRKDGEKMKSGFKLARSPFHRLDSQRPSPPNQASSVGQVSVKSIGLVGDMMTAFRSLLREVPAHNLAIGHNASAIVPAPYPAVAAMFLMPLPFEVFARHGCSPAGGPTPGAAVHVPAGGDEHVRYDEEWTNEHLMRRAKTILQPRTGVRMEGHLCSRRSVRYLIREGKTLALAWVTMPGGAEIGQSVATAERQPLDTSGEPPSKSCVAGRLFD
ncbi:hypothetical protein AK812_SmicGene7148 [Symbiodinium microadriaticum]|uniref:Uncharacterized protein n=1 Tax=Symbiodinium microadriaticum TaxID=2951 RepID=A0A1Q9EPA5_SYMMI|nr:hypothetical protein AK812_SmicGene7148 [Symbiodinium microadriaticum]